MKTVNFIALVPFALIVLGLLTGCPPGGKYVLLVMFQGDGTVEPAAGTYRSGTLVTLTPMAAEGWQFDHWEQGLTGNTNPGQLLMDTNKTVVAVFRQRMFSVTVGANGQGAVSLNPPGGEYSFGTLVTLTATPDANWHFKDWTGDITGSINPLQVAVDGDLAVTAVFELDQFLLTTSVVNGNGLLSPETGQRNVNEIVTLTATPNAGYRVRFWTGTDNDLSTANTNQVTMTGQKNVTVEFELIGGGNEEETIILPGNVPLIMIKCPPGSFMMGHYPGEQGANSGNEVPQHPVTFESGFWIGKYELTQGQWAAVMNSNPSNNWARPDSNNRPVEQVSWDDARDFIAALNALTGKAFRLPSESEWEYACRAGDNTEPTRFYWGDDLDYIDIRNYAWYLGNRYDDYWDAYTHVVGRKLPNGWGLYDMSGNVDEWCEDDYYQDYSYSFADGSPFIDSPRLSTRVYRGGNFASEGGACRSAYRGAWEPWRVYSSLGFRLARDEN